jgi:hypothetical protein
VESFVDIGTGRRVYIARESLETAISLGSDRKSAVKELPEVIYSEVRILTANKLTRNFTFYPKESLEGDPSKGTGVISCVYPYPIPILREHLSGSSAFGGSVSDVYGRVINAELVTKSGSDGKPVSYVRGVFKITHPEAIEAVLKERWLTVSAGMRVDQVFCSICGADLCASGEPCGHVKGQAYEVDEESVSDDDILDDQGRRICYWKMGPVQFLEVSFVNIPSDSEARILRPNIGAVEAVSYAKFGSKVIRLSDGVDVTSTGEVPGFMKVNESFDDAFCCSDSIDEKDLRARDLKRLRASQFCGDPEKKEFPVPDAAHVRLGFAMLKRYKGSTPKSKIHACLVRKAKQFGVNHDSKNCPYCQRGEELILALLSGKR